MVEPVPRVQLSLKAMAAAADVRQALEPTTAPVHGEKGRDGAAPRRQ